MSASREEHVPHPPGAGKTPAQSAAGAAADEQLDRKRRRDHHFQVIALVVVLAVSVAYTAVAMQLPLGTMQRPGTGLLPAIIGGMLLVFTSSALVDTLRPRRDGLDADEDRGELSSYGAGGAAWRVPAILGVLVAYILLASRAGHLIASVVTIAAAIRLLGQRPWWQVILFSVLLGVGAHYLFQELLGMVLPRGAWDVL